MKCPICKKDASASVENRYRPFCSKRCADVDLGKWLNESYAVPDDDPDALEQAAQELARKLH